MCRFFTVGLLGLTAIYIGFVVLLHLTAPECLDEPCQSEGVDNSIVNWGSDFFVAVALFLFGIHLNCTKNQVRQDQQQVVCKSGILAQIFMGGSFLLMGICHWMYANNGLGDSKGMIGFWIFWAVASSFFTFSAWSHAIFAKEATQNLSISHLPCCASTALRLYQGMVVLSCAANIVGCIWCAGMPRLHVDDIIDEFETNDDFLLEGAPTCVRVVTISNISLWTSYALLWIPMGLLLKSAARQNPAQICGLITPIAAGSTVLLQWTVGAMYFVILAFVAWLRRDNFLELYEQAYGAEIVHYGMLMTFYCAHNLSWSLTSPKQGTGAKVAPKSPLAGQVNKAEQGILKNLKTGFSRQSNVKKNASFADDA